MYEGQSNEGSSEIDRSRSFRAESAKLEMIEQSGAVMRSISDILFGVRNFPSLGALAFLLCVGIPPALVKSSVSGARNVYAQQNPSPPPQTPQPLPSTAPQPSGFVVVLDPAHGGTDSGARGDSGVVEKDLVLQFARAAKSDIERQGYRVIMTRNDDSNPSYDDRAATANAHRDAIYISLHVASSGTIGTARAYYYQFWTPISPALSSPTGASAGAGEAQSGALVAPTPATNSGLLSWQEAQRPYQDTSRRLADILQIQLAQAFAGSPATATGAEERELRSVVAPAAAVEISSVSVPDPKTLAALASPLGASVAKTVAMFRAAGAR